MCIDLRIDVNILNAQGATPLHLTHSPDVIEVSIITHTPTHARTHAHAHTHTHTHARMHSCTHAHAHTRVYTRVYTHIANVP